MQSHVKLTVPGKYAEDFRAASAYELSDEGKCVLRDRAKHKEAQRWSDGPASPRSDELDASLRMLAVDAAVYQQAAGLEGADIAIDIDDPTAAFRMWSKRWRGGSSVRSSPRPCRSGRWIPTTCRGSMR